MRLLLLVLLAGATPALADTDADTDAGTGADSDTATGYPSGGQLASDLKGAGGCACDGAGGSGAGLLLGLTALLAVRSRRAR